MICVMISQTMFFYSYFVIPFLQLKQALAGLLSEALFLTAHMFKPHQDHTTCCNVLKQQPCLPVARFKNLQGHCSRNVTETCAVCLVDFEDEDSVSQLSKCRHVFHVHCLEKWMEGNHFTCPLCRSLFFNVKTSHEKCDDNFLPWIY